MKRPPCVLETERTALGATLSGDTDSAEIVTAELEAIDFFSDSNRQVFLAVKELTDTGLTVNPVSVMERSGVPLADLSLLTEAAVSVSKTQLKTLVSDISRISGLRSVFNACNNASNSISKEAKLEEVLDKLETGLYRMDKSGSSEAKDGSDVFTAVKGDLLKRIAVGGGVQISTGLKELDRAIVGLRPGKMIVLAGRPSMGKTALADTIRRAVIKQGYGAIEFSLEMSAEELIERELAIQSGVNLRKVLAAKDVTEDELARLGDSGGDLIPGRWFIDDRTYNIAGIRRRARILSGRMARQGIKTGLVILDYIQLAGESGEHREQAIAAISRGCKLMAKELGCSVLALSQLNRACEARDDRRPLMADLRESGAIEQDADIVAFVYREHMYNNSVPPDETELLIRKHRSGPTGTVKLTYNPRVVAFQD